MSERIEKALAEVGNEQVPPAGWQGRVLAQIERPPRRETQWAPWLVAAVATVAAMVIAVVSWREHARVKRLEDLAIQRKVEMERQDAELREHIATQLAEMKARDEENEKLINQLKAAQDAAEQKHIQDEIAANRARKQAEAETYERMRSADIKRRNAPVVAKCKDTNDPLCGI